MPENKETPDWFYKAAGVVTLGILIWLCWLVTVVVLRWIG